MRIFRSVFKMTLAFMLFACASASAADLSEELADMQAKLAAMEARMALSNESDVSADATSLTTMKRNGKMTIGGDVAVDIQMRRRDDVTSDHDVVSSTTFSTNSANLRFRVEATKNSYLYIKLDLDDAWYDDRLDNDADQDDLLEECKFVFTNIRNTNFDFIFGKGEVPYGQDKTLGIIQSYHHNHSSWFGDNVYTSEGPVFIVAGVEENTGRQENSANNPHISVGNTAHPGEVDNVFLMQLNYSWKNFLQAQIALFQNADYNGQGSITRGMHEDRSDDNMFFQSFAARVWIAASNALTLEFSFMNMHIDSRDDREQFGSNSQADQQACSIGFNYKKPGNRLGVFGEYQHGWNWGYTRDYYCDIAQLGFQWDMTNSLTVGMMYEWLGIHDESTTGDEDYQKLVISGQYKLDSGITFIAEYGYEQFNAELANGDDDRDGHLVAFRTAWNF